MDFIGELEGALLRLHQLADETVELSDRIPAMAPDFELEDCARLTAALKRARDSVGDAKARLTDATDGLAKRFASLILNQHGDTKYATDDQLFVVIMRSFWAPPSLDTHPDDFAKFVEWCKAEGHDPFELAIYKRKLAAVCDAVRKEGGNLPTVIGEHTRVRVDVRKRRRKTTN